MSGCLSHAYLGDQNPIGSTEPLLVTATVDPKGVSHVQLRDPTERAIQYFCSLVAWIRDTRTIDRIVLCENSNTRVSFESLQRFARKYQKDLEVIIFDGNSEAGVYGKGYGEGQIIRHAIENSKSLKGAESFYKITGRYFVENFDTWAASFRHRQSVFYECYYRPVRKVGPIRLVYVLTKRLSGKPWAKRRLATMKYYIDTTLKAPVMVNTQFFKCSTRFYKQELLSLYTEADDRAGRTIELCFHKKFRHHSAEKEFRPAPGMLGMSGSMGKVYYREYPPETRVLAERLFRDSNPEWKD